jgi:hypothetical protein
MNARKVKIFESASMQGLEDDINEWLQWIGHKYIESIAYSASRDAYSALVYYHLLPPATDPHQTEPLP